MWNGDRGWGSPFSTRVFEAFSLSGVAERERGAPVELEDWIFSWRGGDIQGGLRKDLLCSLFVLFLIFDKLDLAVL